MKKEKWTVRELKNHLEELVIRGQGNKVVMIDVNEHYKNLEIIQTPTSDEYKDKIHLL